MDNTTNLSLPYILPSQAQKHVTFNEAVNRLDAIVQMGVVSRTQATPPAAPSEGERHIVPDGGGWAGTAGWIAAFQDGAWAYLQPQDGWLAWIADEGVLVVRSAGAWQLATALNPVPLVGVNAIADATNRLAVKSDAVLVSHDDETPGTGDTRLVLNKSAADKTASVVFQTGWSGRAEFGLSGDDDWRVKVSADGATWTEALRVDRATGRVHTPNTPRREVLDAARTYHVRADGSDSNNGLADSAAGAFCTIQHAIDVVYGTLDLNGHDVTIRIANGTYPEALQVLSPQVGAGRIILLGDTATPSNVTVSSGGSTSLYVKGAGSKIFVAGIKCTNTSGLAGWYADGGGCIEARGNNEMGAVGGHHFLADGPSFIYMSHPLILSGGCAGWHLNANSNGYIYIQTGSWTILGSPTCGGFANAVAGGVIYAFTNSFTGTFYGARYSASLNGVIQTNSAGNVNYFPGSSAGTASSGGQYA